MAKVAGLPQLVWDGTATLELAFPDSWEIEMCHMAGHDRPALEASLIRQAILDPIGSPPISETAGGRKEVCIIFDDMSRPTRVATIIPFVLEELAKAGIGDHQIRFVCALGCHGALTRRDFVKKLGEDVVSRFPVFNHNLVGASTLVGTTSFGPSSTSTPKWSGATTRSPSVPSYPTPLPASAAERRSSCRGGLVRDRARHAPHESGCRRLGRRQHR